MKANPRTKQEFRSDARSGAGFKGKFIVIDASDGSGKATQTKLLVQRLEQNGKNVFSIDFPRYDTNLLGELIGECLAGEHGNFPKLDSHIASVLYAGDRFESKSQIEEALSHGAIVISDRYTSSNQLHQGGKIKDEKERKAFLEWLERLEYKTFGIPKPDAVIYLDVPVDISLRLLEKSVGKKKYLKDRKDLVEHDRDYLENSRAAARALATNEDNWHLIECVENGELLSQERIHERVYGIVKEIV